MITAIRQVSMNTSCCLRTLGRDRAAPENSPTSHRSPAGTVAMCSRNRVLNPVYHSNCSIAQGVHTGEIAYGTNEQLGCVLSLLFAACSAPAVQDDPGYVHDGQRRRRLRPGLALHSVSVTHLVCKTLIIITMPRDAAI